MFPFVNREGRELEGLPEPVHVGSESSLGESAGDTVDVIRLILGTSAPCNLVAVARRWRFTAEVRFIEFRPEKGIFEEVVDSVNMLGKFGVVSEFIVGIVQRN